MSEKIKKSCRECGDMLKQIVDENTKLRALVKELADALDGSTYLVDGLTCHVNLRHRALVTRAREVVK